MHCSANTDMNGENTAIFFGCPAPARPPSPPTRSAFSSATTSTAGTTTACLTSRAAATPRSSTSTRSPSPDIYNAIKRNALLENVTLDKDGKIDFADKSVTENTRVSYPIDHIEKIVRPVSSAPAAKNVIFLSADAFGVLPPVSILTPEQTSTTSCPASPRSWPAPSAASPSPPRPSPPASARPSSSCIRPSTPKSSSRRWKRAARRLTSVNTGWNGTGKRISIKDTRGIIDAILNGDINKAPTKKLPYFDFEIPTELTGVATEILDPRDTYADAADWDVKAKDLASRFVKNFVKYEGNEAGKALVAAGPQL